MDIPTPRLMVMMPTLDGNVCAESVGGLLSINHLIASVFFCVQCSDIRAARNLMAKQFLSSDCEWALWLDADIGFHLTDLEKLFAFNAPLALGAYARKGYGMDVGGTQAGFGFVLMHRSVLEKLDGHCRVAEYNGQPLVDFFPAGPDAQGVWFGEDRAFFNLCAAHGITVNVADDCALSHIGRIRYTLTNTQAASGMKLEAA